MESALACAIRLLREGGADNEADALEVMADALEDALSSLNRHHERLCLLEKEHRLPPHLRTDFNWRTAEPAAEPSAAPGAEER